MSFVWPLYPFTATSPTWATTTGLNALATVHPRPSRTRLTNSPASSITSLPLVSLMTKPSLPSLKLATRNADSVNCNPSHGKWVTQSWRQPCDLQFLERGVQTLSCQFIHTFPVCAVVGGFAAFLFNGAATPPLQGGECALPISGRVGGRTCT